MLRAPQAALGHILLNSGDTIWLTRVAVAAAEGLVAAPAFAGQ